MAFRTPLPLTGAISTLGLIAGLSLCGAPAARATVTVTSSSFTSVPLSGSSDTTQTFDLTGIGATDWVNLGNYSSTPNYKAGPAANGGVGDISIPVAYTAGSGTANTANFSYTNYQAVPGVVWEDGASVNGSFATSNSDPQANSTVNGNSHVDEHSWQNGGTNNGFSFTVTLPGSSANTTEVFVAGYNVATNFQIYDGATLLTSSSSLNANGANASGILIDRLSNNSAAPETLTYNFYETQPYGGFDNAKLESITLASSPAPEPGQGGMLAVIAAGMGGLILRARRSAGQVAS